MRKGFTTDSDVVQDILDRAMFMHLAINDADGPHVVPVNFAAKDGVIYMHSGAKGRKMEALRSGAHVAFSVLGRTELKDGDKACEFGYKYESVVGAGVPEILEDDAERLEHLKFIAAKYGAEKCPISEKAMKATVVIAIKTTEITARVRDI